LVVWALTPGLLRRVPSEAGRQDSLSPDCGRGGTEFRGADGGEEGGRVVGGEPAHEEVGGLEFGLADALAVVLGQFDEGFAGLGDDEEGLQEALVAGGEAAVLEGVEVTFGRA
jgi:hypothetical protein